MEMSAEELRKAREVGRMLHNPNRTPHKHCDLIKAWADGAQIQRYSPAYGWMDIYTTPLWDDFAEQFRIKPKTIKYRLYLTIYGNVQTWHNQDKPPSCIFARWLGDWQEVEV